MTQYYPIVLAGGKSLAGDSIGFHAYSLRIDNLTNQWLLEETSLAWIPPYSLGVCLRLYGTGVAIILNRAPVGQPQLAPITGEETIGVYSDVLRTEVAGSPVRQFTLVQSVSDLTEGPQPALPPVGVDRLYADPSGNIHHLHSDGTDLTLVDPSNAGTLLYPTFDPHYQALMSATAVGGDSSGTVANMVNVRASNGFSVLGAARPSLILPGIGTPAASSIGWTDVGAGPMAIQLATVGGAAASNLMRFHVATGVSGQMLPVLVLDGSMRTTLNGPLTLTGLQSTARPDITLPGVSGGVLNTLQWTDAGAGVMAIALNSVGGLPSNNLMRFLVANGSSGGSISALQLTGDGLVTGAVFVATSQLRVNTNPAVQLAGIAGAVTNSVQWGDVGAGPMAIALNSYGGVPVNNVMQFKIATGSSGGSIATLTLDGAGRALIPVDTLMGAGNVAATITTGFPYLPFTGGTPTGVPAWAASTAMVPVIFGPSLRLYAYISGAWHFVTFT